MVKELKLCSAKQKFVDEKTGQAVEFTNIYGIFDDVYLIHIEKNDKNVLKRFLKANKDNEIRVTGIIKNEV